MSYEQAARDAGVNLDMPLLRAGNFDPVAQVHDVLFVSGSIALAPGGGIDFVGRLGGDMDIETGQASARGAAEAILASVHQHLGSLDDVLRVVRLTGYVASDPGFNAQPTVINGASDLMIEVFGDAGRHARSAIGVAELPLGASVEVEAIFQIEH
jgi:enamine deaminase RidA (YjgF/YER057c/UK114 family)